MKNEDARFRRGFDYWQWNSSILVLTDVAINRIFEYLCYCERNIYENCQHIYQPMRRGSHLAYPRSLGLITGSGI